MSRICFSAAVFSGPGEPLCVQTLELPSTPPAGEVLVKLAASGVCHSDYHVLVGEWAAPVPMVLGHEGAGVVHAVGPGVTQVSEGDHVILSWAPSCRVCEFCVSGRPVLCELMNQTAAQHLSFDGGTRFTRDGEPVHGIASLGTFAEYLMAPESGVIRIRQDAPLAPASLIGCAVTTGIGAAINTARVRVGSSVLVVGCGGVGINVIQGARLAGAGQIIAAVVSEDKLALARKFGATHTINGREHDMVDAAKELTGGRGVDYAFEAIGLARTIEQCYEAIVRGGTAVVVGQVADGVRVSIDPFVMSDQEKTLTGSNYGSARPALDFPRILDLYMDGRVELDALVTGRISLDGINEAFAAMGRGEGIRSVIEY
jgi:S-(hydroxymethyl)glutathione dehydrogenase / alcohol dehydrogenase